MPPQSFESRELMQVEVPYLRFLEPSVGHLTRAVMFKRLTQNALRVILDVE